MLTVAHSLSLGQCWMLRFVCLLSVPWSWASFCACSLVYWKSLPLLPLKASAWPRTKWECVWVMWMESGGQLEGPIGRLPLVACGGLPDGVCNTVSRIHMPLMLLRILSDSSRLLPHASHDSAPGWGEREVVPSDKVPHIWENPILNFMFSFPLWG